MKSLGSVTEMDVLCVDMSRLLAKEEDMDSILKDLVLKCIYEKSLIYLDKTPFESRELSKVQRVLTFLQDYVKLLFVGSKDQRPKTLSVQGSWYTISLESPFTWEDLELPDSSKYIGETEKNLGAVFEAARFSNAVLFFDEADALLTKRTEVRRQNRGRLEISTLLKP